MTTDRTLPDLLGVSEVAALLQVRPNTVSVWRKRGLMPPADLRVKAGHLWLRTTIVAWATTTGRMPEQEDTDGLG
jgi:hypothetical protein